MSVQTPKRLKGIMGISADTYIMRSIRMQKSDKRLDARSYRLLPRAIEREFPPTAIYHAEGC